MRRVCVAPNRRLKQQQPRRPWEPLFPPGERLFSPDPDVGRNQAPCSSSTGGLAGRTAGARCWEALQGAQVSSHTPASAQLPVASSESQTQPGPVNSLPPAAERQGLQKPPWQPRERRVSHRQRFLPCELRRQRTEAEERGRGL